MAGFRVGEKVDYHSIIGGEITSRNHTIIDMGTLGHSEPVAWLSDKRGAVSLEALSKSVE